MSFDLLNPVVQHHIVNSLGWAGLRPLQERAIAPLLSGDDALLLAPTAGGKTEAALFPLLTRMHAERWDGTSVLYVTPLRALLNNLEPRIKEYASWLGRTVGVRHGDTTAGQRARLLRERPDLLLTTPESLEAMLISVKVTPEETFADVRAIVVDEVHAFAGDDRGWHLQGVLDRLTALAGRPIQRIGLSATVGNADDLLVWLQGSGRDWGRAGAVVNPPAAGAGEPELHLDHVGSVAGAATVIAGLHQGEKRLVFCESRRQVEGLATALRERVVETYLSHSSLSLDERRAAETAFAYSRDCVIVSTSTLELGIDVGDLDRVIQLGSTRSVASMLQRLGRTGRRPGTARNMLFLGVESEDFLRAAAVLLLWSEGYVEPVVPPSAPVHVLAQQLLGTVLQEGAIGAEELSARGDALGWGSAGEVVEWLETEGFLDRDGDLLFVGEEAERRYGRIHYRDLVAVFTAPPQFVVLQGRSEIGQIDPLMLTRKVDGPRIILLGGRPWRVTYTDWQRKRAYVEPAESAGDIRWVSAPVVESYAVADAARRVLLGADPGVRLTRRAVAALAEVRAEHAHRVAADATVIVQESTGPRWWTWAGARANAVLVAALAQVAPELLDDEAYTNRNIRLRGDATGTAVTRALWDARQRFGPEFEGVRPGVTEEAVRGLKFAELLPPELAIGALAERNTDHVGAATVAERAVTEKGSRA
ncbi:MAG TPA: DEAD/DEAH box helicase [Propionibacterium sp.]|nr:DEAD/DEAH box helicase [Propionibacterium sp.]